MGPTLAQRPQRTSPYLRQNGTLKGRRSSGSCPVPRAAGGASCMHSTRSLQASWVVSANYRGRSCSHWSVPPAPAACQAAPAAGAPSAAAAATEAAVGATAGWAQSRGVPLVDTVVGMPLPVAAARSLAMLAGCAVVVALGRWALAEMDKRLCAMMDATKRARGLQLLVWTALVAAHRPASALLPLYGLSYSLTVLSALVEVAVAKSGLGCYPKLRFCGQHLVRLLKTVTQGLEEASQLVLILAAAWFLVAWKDKLVERVVERLRNNEDPDDDQWERILLPLSRLLTWVVVGGASVAGLGAVGIDIRPVLALGSVGSLVVGLAAQTTLSNVVSAMSLYTSRPFVVGDRVQLKSMGGSTILEGEVEQISPMRTVFRTDARVPVYMNNKDITTMLIVNESQLRRVGAVAPPLACRRLDARITVRYQDVRLVPVLEEAITEYLASYPEIDHGLSCGCVMDSFTDTGICLRIQAHLTWAAGSRTSQVRSAVLLDVDRVIRSAGAHLAIPGADALYGSDGEGPAGAQHAQRSSAQRAA